MTSIPFPKNVREVQSAMGCANMFLRFVPQYADLAARINEMASKKFNWDRRSTWIHDYEGIWSAFLSALLHAHEIYYPDYTLEWFLRTDASQLGVAAVLFQIRHITTSENSSTIQNAISAEPIAIVSQKFSEQATRWDTIEQEA